MRLVNFIIIALLTILISSCQNDVLYDNTKPIKDSWITNDYKSFEVLVDDSLQAYNFYLNIRNSLNYRYSNIYFFLETKFPNGEYSIDTIECILADNTGKWIGKGIGKHRDNQILLRRRGAFPMKGEYVFTLKQAMRDKNLEGIKAVGIRIEKFEPEN